MKLVALALPLVFAVTPALARSECEPLWRQAAVQQVPEEMLDSAYDRLSDLYSHYFESDVAAYRAELAQIKTMQQRYPLAVEWAECQSHVFSELRKLPPISTFASAGSKKSRNDPKIFTCIPAGVTQICNEN